MFRFLVNQLATTPTLGIQAVHRTATTLHLHQPSLEVVVVREAFLLVTPQDLLPLATRHHTALMISTSRCSTTVLTNRDYLNRQQTLLEAMEMLNITHTSTRT